MPNFHNFCILDLGYSTEFKMIENKEEAYKRGMSLEDIRKTAAG